jgi:hypothetical protein
MIKEHNEVNYRKYKDSAKHVSDLVTNLLSLQLTNLNVNSFLKNLWINFITIMMNGSYFYPVGPNDDLNAINELIQSDLNRLAAWSKLWKLDFSASKSVEVIFHNSRRGLRANPYFYLNGDQVPRKKSHKHLGFVWDECLAFDEHLTSVIVKCNNMLHPLIVLKQSVRLRHLERIYMSYILPLLEFGAIILDSANQNLLCQLDKIHYRADLAVSGCILGTNTHKVLRCLDWMTLGERREKKGPFV